MKRSLTAAVATAISLTVASPVGADNNVKWTMSVGSPGVAVALPITLFKDRPVPIRSERWRCFVDNALRQDAEANTFSTLSVHCTDGETTVLTSASCLIGAHNEDRLGVDLVEKSVTTTIRARCSG